MIISISGVSGSGKSSVAKLLAKELGYKHYSMGDLQRKFAEEKGMTIVELGELEKKDDSIDREIDAYQTTLSEKEDDFVIDSWLSARFIKKAYKVFLDCDIDIRAHRIYDEVNSGKNKANIDHKRKSEKKYSSYDETKSHILKKESDNHERWIKYYGFDFTDPKNFNLVIDTSNLSIEETKDKILASLTHRIVSSSS